MSNGSSRGLKSCEKEGYREVLEKSNSLSSCRCSCRPRLTLDGFCITQEERLSSEDCWYCNRCKESASISASGHG